MNPIFKQSLFWTFFKHMEADITDEDITKMANLLRQNYEVQQEEIIYDEKYINHLTERLGAETTQRILAKRKIPEYTSPIAIIPLPINEQYQLVLRLTLCVGGLDKVFYLQERGSGAEYILGFWNLANWHPYFLRFEELQSLMEYWKDKPDRDIYFLFLSDFVGCVNVEELVYLESQDKYILSEMGVELLLDEANQEYTTDDFQEDLKENNNRWIIDNELGYTFVADKWCYTLRNRSHIASYWGTFPFTQWQDMINSF